MMLLIVKPAEISKPSIEGAVNCTTTLLPAATVATATIVLNSGAPTNATAEPATLPERVNSTMEYDPFRSSKSALPNTANVEISALIFVGFLSFLCRRQTINGSVGKPSFGLSVHRNCKTWGNSFGTVVAFSSKPNRRATIDQRRYAPSA
ncbi:hypothetical protein G1O98_26965 [Nostoc sp. UIC10630]|nr:hypothetical protein [Nostoc sp. UIC 10630]NEU82587.1 hypothetical protein [Nostoc sp. UIC 10630]